MDPGWERWLGGTEGREIRGKHGQNVIYHRRIKQYFFKKYNLG